MRWRSRTEDAGPIRLHVLDEPLCIGLQIVVSIFTTNACNCRPPLRITLGTGNARLHTRTIQTRPDCGGAQMKVRVLLPLILVAVTLAWVGSASALSISFIEPISPTGNVDVSVLNLTAVGTIATAPESASVTVGTVTASSSVLAAVGLTQPGSMHMEGGGAGISDLIILRTFSSVTGLPVGFQVSFQSDTETGIPNPRNLTKTIVETGLPQTVLSGAFVLPVVGSVDLTVTAQSDLDPVPEPSTLLLFGSGLAGVATLWRRYRHS